MLCLARRSLLIQLLSVYLLFVVIVLLGGLGVNAVGQQQLGNDVEATDQALAQEIALETSNHLLDAENAMKALGNLVRQNNTPAAITSFFHAFQATRTDVDYVTWLNPFGAITISWPPGKVAPGGEFSPPAVIQQAISPRSTTPVFEVGIIDISNSSSKPGVIIAQSVRTPAGQLLGIVAANFALNELNGPVSSVVQAQQRQGRQLMISVIDSNGELVARGDSREFLQTVLDELPGANQALHGHPSSQLAPGSDGQDWLFSAVPVPLIGWAVIVQRPASEAFAVIAQFHIWLFAAALLFALGGLLFWLILLSRVIRPLHTLAIQHQALPVSEQAIPVHATVLARRTDEVGDLARSLIRLECDGLEKLGELRTLLETSNAVVGSLEPRAVVGQIIREARRLVHVQAAAVLLPDYEGTLRVLVSDGHSKRYDEELVLSPEKNVSSAPVLALRDSKPIQKLLGPGQSSFAYSEGFRSVLAIPIISRHAGAVVLLVHRTEPRLFNQNEIDLLLTFANYATLAWEHAVLYERSDVRLRQVALENELLYQQASEEKQKLEAIMGSMSDGLVLTGIDGMILYANLGASAIAGLPGENLVGSPINVLYEALHSQAVEPADCAHTVARMQSVETVESVVEMKRDNRRHSIHLRLFDVGDESGQAIGRGLLLRDVTRERELDEFKTTLLAAVGHELRTPLAAIKGHASTLLQEDISWPLADQRHFLQTISSEADRLAQLVSNLLDLSRQEAGLLLLNRSPLRVQDLVTKIIERLNQPPITISLHIPANLPPVNVDGARVEVVLYNLVTNALLYGEDKICISAEQRDNGVVMSVWDNGPGIAPDELPHVFERFYRARHGRQQHSGGTGLGLAICKAFVEAHGGIIWATNSEQGTSISFSLPLILPADITDLVSAVKDDLAPAPALPAGEVAERRDA